MMKRILLAFGLLLGCCSPTLAATCANTALLVKDATTPTPLTDPVPYIDTGDGSGQCVPKVFVFNASPNGAHNTANSPTVNVATDQSGNAYFTIAASVTAQVLGATGATGDYLGFCTIYPTSTSPGVLTVFDSTSSATNNAIAFAGGATSLSNLTPINIPVGAISKNGAWKVTTGANMVVTCNGHFT